MPKIDAPTVAEHHRLRRAALLRAAQELVATGGLESLTLTAVGRAAGLARSSVYQYFDSPAALIAALVEDLMPRSAEHLASAATPGEPADRVEAFVRAALRTATDPTHRALAELTSGPADAVPEECTARLAELHRDQAAPLRAALVDLDVAEPELTTDLLMGVVQAAVHAVLAGRPLDAVTSRTLAVVHGAISA
ncbi:TetR/AcrR family transcriptional regulator [Isoptericola sp. b441]|uniref:TetR/AcrR family transcriptional regulator n=1 Tax=Actinotalea lenta TaxID=3064654 RepID=A0ABT9D6B8_9CELL|nr:MULTISPECIES: TetR/AcrR family transcriptional regulator [unclassified Isoptericola]MDO8106368.1 TetR/AcrR family transcriptional regulator [Isoptericola sp. b441]MDO8121913.1 TetR/AcrR family transcriptional regulator [Isoptericola sp. b490]